MHTTYVWHVTALEFSDTLILKGVVTVVCVLPFLKIKILCVVSKFEMTHAVLNIY